MHIAKPVQCENMQCNINIKLLYTFKVLSTAREYFNCSTLQYVPLENQGGSGSAS